MINIFGENHEEIGSTDKNLILKTLGKIRILWGKKFIDLLDKDGNINAGIGKLIKSISSPDLINKDGFYYLNGDLVASIGGKQIIVGSESGNTFVSFLINQETTSELKKTALKNIGLYADTKKDVSITNGIIYVEDEKTMYIVNNGALTKFLAEIPNPYPKQFVILKEDQNSLGSLIIKGSGINNSLSFDTLDIYSDNGAIYKSNLHLFIVNNNKVALINENGIITNLISSEGSNSLKGYRIYNEKGKYILDIDSLNVRDGLNVLPNIYPLEYYPNRNIILSTKEIKSGNIVNTKCYLKYPNIYKSGDTLLVYDSNLNKLKLPIIESKEDYVITNNLVELSNVKCDLISENLAIGEIESKYNSKNVGIISKLNIFYSTKFDKEGSGDKIYPFYSNTLYEELEPNIENYNYVIPPIGLIKKLQLVHSAEYVKNKKLIYFRDYSGNNLFTIDATDFIKDGMVSNVYIEGKNLYITFNTDSGKDTIIIPISKIFDSSKYYTKSEIDLMISSSSTSSTPIGTILMWPGSNLPTGYLVCDGSTFSKDDCPELYNILGSNKLPDLRDRFIVGAGNEYNLGDIGGEKEHTLSVEELPSHSHNYSSDGDDAWASNRIVDRTDKSCYGDSNYSSAWLYKTESTGGGSAHENRPPYYALYFIIRASNSSVTPTPSPTPPVEKITITFNITNNTGKPTIYYDYIDLLGITSIALNKSYSGGLVSVEIDSNYIGKTFNSIILRDTNIEHVAYTTNSDGGTITENAVYNITAINEV